MFNSINMKDISLSIRDGLYIPFIYKGRQIVAHNASWSFREKIWVDDRLVVSRIGLSMASTHVLEVEGDRLEITFGYRTGMKEIFLEARVGDELVHEVSHSVGKDVKPRTRALIAVGAGLAGVVLGYTVAHLVGWLVGGA